MGEKNNSTEKAPIALREERVLDFWNKNKILEKSVEEPAGNKNPKEFTFYDGPPFATGAPHYGHLLQSFVKDTVPRYKTMRGYRVKRQWGWDCHGLPIENIVEKELGISGKEDIEKMGVKKFNNKCREKIFEYVDIWEKIIPRIGRWADMEGAYKTMDTSYMESEWWAFSELYKKGLIYESYRSMHICPRCETTLSQSEVTEGYKDIKDLSVTAKFKLVDEPNTFVLAWTTTPWTLPGNAALAVGADIVYEKVRKNAEVRERKGGEPFSSDPEFGEHYWVAKEILDNPARLGESKFGELFGKMVERTGETKKGSELAGLEYEPLFDFYARDENLENRENGWKIYSADFVTTEEGTGIVHIAPAFGEDDMAIARRENLPFVQHVRMDGQFADEVTGELGGLNVKPRSDDESVRLGTDIEVIRYLQDNNLFFSKEKYEHRYPHCWRCDTPLLNYATSSWFVAVEKIKDKLLKTAEGINWIPAHIKEGRWGNWLEGARDWSISRSRFWANTIPVWRCGSCDHEVVVGSIDELEKYSGVRVDDLHKDVVDEVTFACGECKSTMKRIPDVLDTWFDSGSVPYATLHYPFENEEKFKARSPVDFIAEAQDQCRAWFYYQHVLAGGLFGSRAFSNCIVTGMVLAEDGKKMSKKLQNYPDPMYIIDKYGADAIRLYILSSPVVRTESLNFSEDQVAEISRKIFGRLINVYEFYDLYRKDIKHASSSGSENILDRWMIARLYELHSQVTEAMEGYELDRAVRGIGDFVDDLSTWYLRRSRERFKGEDEVEKKAALETMRFVLRKFVKLLAPFAPFHSDWIWREVKREDDAESVHLSHWCASGEVEQGIIKEMEEIRRIVTLALDARGVADIVVRQPLALLRIKNNELRIKDDYLLQIIADEVNVKEVKFDSSISDEVELDTNITPELKEEGNLRKLLRSIQNERKKNNLKPGEMVSIKINAPKGTQELAKKYKEEIVKVAFVSGFEFVDGEKLEVEI